MYENPVKEWAKPTIRQYPVRVCCVVDDIAHNDARIPPIRSYAHSTGATFISREYDSEKFSDDRNMIERLPAFHIYINKAYQKTFYFDSNPLEQIDESILHCISIKEKKWSILSWIKSALRGRKSLIRSK